MGCCCSDTECRFEEAPDTSLTIEFLDGKCNISADWYGVPRVGDSVYLESRLVEDTCSITGIVTSVQWRSIRGCNANPVTLIGINGFDLKSVAITITDGSYGLKWEDETDADAVL